MVKLSQVTAYDADVLVVGAGPAGAAAAYHLAQRGFGVLLLDRQRFPRDKVCGDFVGPVAIMELDRLGITELPAYEESATIHSAALHVNGKEIIRQPIPAVEGVPRSGRVIPRLVLDDWIYRAAIGAGARPLHAKITALRSDDDGVHVEANVDGTKRTWYVRAVIGADGSGSIVSRTLRGRSPAETDRIIAVRAYYRGVEGSGDTCDLYFSSDSFPGYYWLFPTAPDEANVGVGMVLKTLPPTEDHLRDLLMDLIGRDPAMRGRLRNATIVGKVLGWPLTTYNPRLPVSGKRMLLTGDAAGLINPLNGEGIQYALLSGRWAADSLEACFNLNDFSDRTLARYDAKIDRELGYDMALASIIVQLIRNRTLNPVWLSALKVIVARAGRDDAYARIVGGILAGIVPASDALSLRVIGGTASQAAVSTAWAVVNQAVKGPNALLSMTGDLADLGCRTAREAFRHPADFAEWMIGIGLSGANLASHAVAHTLESRRTVP